MLLHKIVFFHKQTLLQKQFFVDPHEGARVVGFTLVLDAAEAVAPLAVVSLVVVVELDLPDGLEKPCLSELSSTETTHQEKLLFLVTWLLVSNTSELHCCTSYF